MQELSFSVRAGLKQHPKLVGTVFRSLVHQHRTHPAPLGPEPPSPPGFTLAGGRRQPPAPGGAASRRLRRAGLRGTAWGGKWGRLPGSPGRPPQREPPRGSQRRPPPSLDGGSRPAEPGSGSPWRGRAGTPRQRPARGLWWAEVPAGGWGGTHKMEPESPGGRRRVSRSFSCPSSPHGEAGWCSGRKVASLPPAFGKTVYFLTYFFNNAASSRKSCFYGISAPCCGIVKCCFEVY